MPSDNKEMKFIVSGDGLIEKLRGGRETWEGVTEWHVES